LFMLLSFSYVLLRGSSRNRKPSLRLLKRLLIGNTSRVRSAVLLFCNSCTNRDG